MERTRPYDGPEEGSRAIHDLTSEMNDWVESLDLQALGRRVQDFGREKPVALALACLTIGVAAGMLMRKRAPLS